MENTTENNFSFPVSEDKELIIIGSGDLKVKIKTDVEVSDVTTSDYKVDSSGSTSDVTFKIEANIKVKNCIVTRVKDSEITEIIEV